MSERVEGEITEYGFNWGAAEVTRMFSDGRQGWVTVGVKTPKHDIQIYVTKTGKVRVHDASGEWLPKVKKATRKRPVKKLEQRRDAMRKAAERLMADGEGYDDAWSPE